MIKATIQQVCSILSSTTRAQGVVLHPPDMAGLGTGNLNLGTGNLGTVTPESIELAPGSVWEPKAR